MKHIIIEGTIVAGIIMLGSNIKRGGIIICPGVEAPWDYREYITMPCPGICGVYYKGATYTPPV